VISISGLFFVSVVLLINLSIGILIITRNSRISLNRWFFILCLSIALWGSSTIVSDTTDNFILARYASFVAYGSSFLAVGVSYMFSEVFRKRSLSKNGRRVFWLICLLTITFSTPYVYNLTTLDDYELGPLYGLYLLSVGLLVILISRNFILAIKRGTILQKSQAKFMLAGIFLTVFLSLITNAIIPAFVDTTATTIIGPLFSAVFVGSAAYAIIKHRLFDIRLIVARSIAYILLVSTLALIYGAGVFGLARLLSAEDPGVNDIGPFVSALVVLVTAPLLKQFFDKMTNHIFYRDAYDPQLFLDQLNKTIVSNIEIGVLLRHTAQVIEENMKADCHIYIREMDEMPSRIMGVTKKEITKGDMNLIREELATLEKKTVLADELEEQYEKLKLVCDENNISLVSSLLTSYASNQEATAYLLLGPKKSGNAYSRQDLQIIDIIADELLIAIQNALRFEEIQEFNITLQKRINDATAKLKRSNEKLKEMDETKDEFISMASHQLRTPLTSVKGYLSMVLDGDAGKISSTQRELLNQAFVSSQRMVYLIADLLNVSRLKTGRFIIEKIPTNLVEMVESEIAQLKEVAKSRKLTLVFDKPKDFPELMLDETKTRQVVMNFVDNAIYYTPAGGHIKIELKTDRHSVYFMVKDDGLGVPKADQPHLFTKFYRAQNAQKARPDGTGLGLFMAKKVINDQGGCILFESTEGKGSTFGFKFDRPKDGPAAK
jgi:signal transduction histidine kinase